MTKTALVVGASGIVGSAMAVIRVAHGGRSMASRVGRLSRKRQIGSRLLADRQ